MLFCPKCRVSVVGDKRCCPLCQGELGGEPSADAYPRPPAEPYSSHLILRVVSFCAITLMIVSVALNLIISPAIWWSLLALGAIGCLWVTVAVGITYRRRLFKNLTLQLLFINTAAVLWDVSVGWLGWSIDYVLPCSCMAYMLCIVILSRFIKGPRNSYIIYLVIDCILGLVPIIFVFTGVLHLPVLSVLSAALSLITLCALLFFEGHALKEEITKKLHM